MSRPYLSPTDHRLRSAVTCSQPIPSEESQHLSPRSNPTGASIIHILDEDSLIVIFHHCQPDLFDEDDPDDGRVIIGGEWTHERWWYKLAQVCQRWRYLIFGSAHHLHLSLVCTRGTPVAEMLEHSPPLPLIIYYVYNGDSMTTELEGQEGILLALKDRDRVRRICLNMPVPNLQSLTMALEGEFPILEYLCLGPMTKQNTSLMFPGSFRAPRLHHLVLRSYAFPIGSPFLTTAMSLVTLSLQWIPPSDYFRPNELLQRLSLMPQLETLGIFFRSPVRNLDVKRELLIMPCMPRVTLPNLRCLGFGGASAYLEALLPCMTVPLLAKLQIMFLYQSTFHLPYFPQFLNAADNLKFNSATLMFGKKWLFVKVYPHKEARMYALHLVIRCQPDLFSQVWSAAQISSALRDVLLTVEDLSLKYWRHDVSSEQLNEPYPPQWRDLLMSFSKVKTLQVDPELVDQLSNSLQDNGESPVVLLPELKKLSYSSLSNTNAFIPFKDTRRVAGRLVTMIRHGIRLFR
ncbi:hypothetical protein BC827DRAFT_873403 [Russula dissimulans]|nr:hypothetical protein BC827DRAFT_873403 [Russula dissimulans]